MASSRFLRGVTPRLVGVTATIVALCITFSGGLATYRHYVRTAEEAARDLNLICTVVVPSIVPPVVTRALALPVHLRRKPLDGLLARLRSYQHDLSDLAIVRAADGREIYRSSDEIPALTAAERTAAVAGQGPVRTTYRVTHGFTVVQTCAMPGGYLARIGIDLPSFQAFLLDQARQDLYWILATLIVASIASTLMIGMLTRSLRNVTSYAAAIERGELVGQIEVKSTDEAGAIAEAFNTVLHRLRGSYVSTLGALAALLETRDRNTESHSQRGLKYAMELGKAAGLSPQALGDLEYGSLLHDIGKVGIADNILRKTGPLTEEEWEVMRQHPSIGYNVLKNIDFLQNALPVVLHHQERWDGKGYPNGLKGEEIPLLARIFCIADSFDAMTSDRPYRRAMRPEIAAREMRRNGGHQFDPRLVEIFVGLWESGQLGRVEAAAARPA